jgi:DNA polymerase III sliding clamp (beta) subunit (PCNA family)
MSVSKRESGTVFATDDSQFFSSADGLEHIEWTDLRDSFDKILDPQFGDIIGRQLIISATDAMYLASNQMMHPYVATDSRVTIVNSVVLSPIVHADGKIVAIAQKIQDILPKLPKSQSNDITD